MAIICPMNHVLVSNIYQRRPVRPKLKFHDDAGGDSDREDETEYAHPEAGHLMIDRVGGPQIQALHNNQDETEPNAQRRIDVVESDGKGKLKACECQRVHGIILARERKASMTGFIKEAV